MRRWDLIVPLDRDRNLPVFLQLASCIADSIRSGRLKPGDPLPGTRGLAERLGVNRNTVVAGYAELAAEGLVCTRMGGGTFVAELIPAPTPSQHVNEAPTYALAPPSCDLPPGEALPAGALAMRGVPDARLFPARVLARAFRRAIESRGRAHLSYAADPCGHTRLRTELAAMLSRSRGLQVSAHNIMVTRSIEQGIDLVARTLIAPGDVVAIEALGYPPVWSVMKLAGARLVPIPLDDDGLDVDALESLLARQKIRAVFLTPHHQFPTTAVMSPQRRLRLATLARKHGFAIVEDDYDHEFHYEGKPILPIAAGPHGANVIYIGSLANLLSPGISAGFVVAPAPVFDRLASLRAASDSRTDAAIECAVAELLEDGELLRHVRRVQRTYAARRDVLSDELRCRLAGIVDFRVPEGGMALWVRVDDSINVGAWARACAREGVMFETARRYDLLQRELPYLRLGFTQRDEAELREGVRRMARALTSRAEWRA